MVGAIALRFMVPNLVVVLITFEGSDPIETEIESSPLPVIGPSIVRGKAAMLVTKGFESRVNFVGS